MHKTLESGKIHLAVDLLMLTVRDGRLTLLLSRRTEAPYPDCWALPGRIVDVTESAEACAKALLNEMLPVENAYMEQLYTFSAVNRDPRGRVISIAYLVIVPWRMLETILAQPQVKLQCFIVSPSAESLRLINLDGTPLSDNLLAFDHGEIIRTGVKRLQGKIDYSDLSFRFLSDPDSFSLGELQSVFEAALGQPLDSSNFRRSILGRYEASGRIQQTEGAKKQGRGRPAALYRYLP